MRQARDGDVLLVSGDLSATDEALVTPALLEITGDGKATLRHLHVSDSSIVFSNLSLLDSFTVDGVSNIELRTVRVEGASGQYGLSFVGGGTLLIDEDTSVAGGTGATGVSISQRGGDLYVSIEGSVRGGADGGRNDAHKDASSDPSAGLDTLDKLKSQISCPVDLKSLAGSM